MADVYFDITDLIAYAASHATVSGIQRVEVRLLAELARAQGAERCWCVAIDKTGRGCVGWRLTDLVVGDADDAMIFSRLADAAAGVGRRPAVRRRLNQLGLGGWKRAVAKIGLSSAMLFATAASSAVGGQRLPGIPAGATFVVLGAGWNHSRTADFAAAHARAGGRVVQCVYDLIPVVCPEYFEHKLVTAFSGHLARAAKYVSEFVCISYHTQRDLERYLHARGLATPSKVVQLAHEFHGYPRNARGCQPRDPTLRGFGGPGREFMLCVGTLEIRKNGRTLLEAWLRLQARLGDATPHLVFCGRRGWKMDPFFDLLAAHDWLKTRVHLVAGANDHDIAFLHERSLCSVYPSLYEGWGLPVGEAAWFGRTCITSQTSSLPEVCGVLADYVDPHSPDEIAERVWRYVIDRDHVQRRERLLAAAKLRTWADVAGDFHRVFHGADSETLRSADAGVVRSRRVA